ncbi:polymorphic toxin-type HINT domain-containing protein [Candidatus Dependentiae bacterium]|nr:polymorphic toxin-type HINT domain-containing protein [Candidatus Dependentiae bacterium]
MKYYLYLSIIILFYTSLFGHGFSSETLIKNSLTIKQICHNFDEENQKVLSYDLNAQQYKKRKIKSVGKSKANCYFRIGFDEYFNNDILCTPTQEFYVPSIKKWVPTFNLKVGDKLLTKSNQSIEITHLEFIKKSRKVYSIEVEKNHNFFVGRHFILTHNMLLPAALSIGIGSSFGAGAAAGCTAGGWFGPVTFVGGAVVGGIVGVAIKVIKGNKIPEYKLVFNKEHIGEHFKNNANPKDSKENPKSDLEKNNDAQAPGKPTENDGFIPKKNWDGKKVKNPNGPGYGWPDKKGKVWIPSGPNGHGCPHWDVEDPNGSYENIVPGGKIRGKNEQR